MLTKRGTILFRSNLCSQEVTFLYKLEEGKSESSYGMNVARMAKIPTSVIATAEQISLEFDEKHSLAVDKMIPLHDLADFQIAVHNTDPVILARVSISK